ncbi:MAG: DEAD/DEAH box helicase family protein, partial [Clostridiales bacterium]|nr:DEAD/DEAH box helicase family protein [Clostridiales bacterium]
MARQNYNLFALAFPEIVNGTYRGMTYENPDNKYVLSVSHDTTTAGDVHFEISYYAPNGDKVYEPTITFEADFERRMLKPVRYANTTTGADIGILSLPSLDDDKRLEALEADIYNLLSDIKKQGFTLKEADVFHDNNGQPGRMASRRVLEGADGSTAPGSADQPLPVEPKPNLTAFLKDRAKHEADVHFNVQRNMFNLGDAVSLNNSDNEIADIFADDDVTLQDGDGGLQQQSLDMFDANVFTNDRNRQSIREGKSPNVDASGTERRNFRITDDHLGEGGAKMKYSFNVTAIRTLQAIESENRLATPEEQETLSRYVGWGGLQQAFDKDNAGWGKEYAELKSLLTPEEYDSARASVLNAHYTSPTVIRAMYETLERMGVTEGNILEPSCGVGNFLGLLPDSMKKAKLYGVELDSITGRMAKQLYQRADIKVMGFEKTDTPDAFFDAAVGNVPFGSYKIVDKRYDKHNFYVHNYFFAKTLDQVRPGGIVAFVTTKGMMDRANPEVRKYIAQRAELLGAVRLPNNAFLKNAGTEVTSDIIFMQKRDRQIDIMPEWVHLGQTEDGLPINSYFVDNPHMMLGRMTNDQGTRMYGSANDTTCEPIPGADLAEQLKEALSHVTGRITEAEFEDIEGIQDHSVPANPAVRNFSYTIVDNTVYFRENSRMYPVDMPAATLERVKGMVELRDVTRMLIDLQLDDYPEHTIKKKQAELNRLYDAFTRKFGLVNDSANARAFQADSSYYLLCSLEILDENSKLKRKSDMFTKRTIKQKKVITSVDTSSEALAVSIGEKARVDIDYMAALTGFTPEKILTDLEGVIFCDIGNPNESLTNFDPDSMKSYEKFPLVTADEYLSGNVREKLARARWFQKDAGDTFHGINVSGNVKALEQAQPKDLEAGEIAVRLGATWIDKSYCQEFMYELLKTPFYLQNAIQVSYSEHTGEWNISGKTQVSYNDVLANVTYGTSRVNAYKIIEETLNLKDVRVYDTKIVDGKEQRILNKKETTLAAQRQDAVKLAFKEWIFKDPERRQTLVALYNARFNSTRPREYDGSHIMFGGMSPEIMLMKHQTGAAARVLYGGNTLLAHEVGAGKTFEMVGAAMELKRLGLCNKSLFAVPNHLTEQWASEFLRLYPSANILVATKKDFEMKNRKKFCAKIATGDYDAAIIGHSQLEKIPLSKERQERLINDQIDELTYGLEELKHSRGERFTIKQMEKTKKNLEARLEKLNDDSKKDNVVTFEQLGIDRLFVDESHFYKNLFLVTKMHNVAGLSTSEAQKSSDMFLKCRYMDEITGGKGIIFATGTPVTNSMTELYTVQRYLQYDSLVNANLQHFDSWAST